MKKISLLVLVIILVFSTSGFSALRKLKDLSRGLPAGVKVYKYQSDDGRAILYVAEIDRRYFPGIQFRTSVARGRVLGRATVRSMVQSAMKNGKNVLLAVNASFGKLDGSYAGVIHNLHIQNRMVVSPPNRYACFGVTESGEFLMEDIKMNISIELAGRQLRVYGLNEERSGSRSVVLYTYKLGSSTRTDSNGYEVVISAPVPLTPGYKNTFTVREVRDSGNTPIPKDGFVLSARKGSEAARLFSQLKVGDQGKLALSFSPDRWNNVVQGIGGNSRLVKHGEPVVDGHRGHNWRKDDPRTALGYNDEKLYLMVVDGRQGGYSIGMTYDDMARAMIEIGATEAINLDGGSSSTFMAQDQVINRPSGGKERHVLNAVFITSEEAKVASSD
ncbi:phosphodiester glycosidase family protein [Candidatus Poribacteria bacterium]